MATGCSDPSRNTPPEDERYGITDTRILIGSALALGGHAGYLGTQTLHGAQSYLNYINEKGGVHGRRIEVIAYDDEYDPPKCVYYTQKLILEDRVFALVLLCGNTDDRKNHTPCEGSENTASGNVYRRQCTQGAIFSLSDQHPSLLLSRNQGRCATYGRSGKHPQSRGVLSV